ncbi:MAG: TolC family protein [Longimicrobiales bacterium]
MTHLSSTRSSRREALALLLFLAVAQAAPLAAQANDFTLQDCISVALEKNPLLHSSQEQYQASLARIHQARALPQPSLDIDSDLQPKAFDFRGSDEQYVGLSQTVPFPGRLYLQGRVAREESNEIRADGDLLRLDLVFQVTYAFYGILLAQEQLDYARQNETLTQDFLDMTEVRFEAGDLAQVEVVRARVEAAKASGQVRAAENEVRLARARMNFLLAREPSTPMELLGELRTPPVSPELEELTQLALASRPEMQRINASLAKESLRKTQGYLSYLPDFDVGVAKHRQTGESDLWDVTLSLSLPLWFWQPVRGEIAEAEANQRALREEATQLANAISLEVQEAFVNLTTAADQIRLFEEGILDQAEEAYRMYQFSYQQGEIGAIDLIEARRTLNDARTSYADALYTYDVARAAIERSVGRPIQEQENGRDPTELAPLSSVSDLSFPDGVQRGLSFRDGPGGRGFQYRNRFRRGASTGGRGPRR